MSYNWKLFIFLMLLGMYVCDDNIKKDYKYHKIMEFFCDSKSDVEKLLGIIKTVDGSTIYEADQERVTALISPNSMPRLMSLVNTIKVLNITVLVNDYSKLLVKETKQMLRTSDDKYSWLDYHDIDDINRYLILMQERYPYLSTLILGGESHEGRKILGIRIFTDMPTDPGKEKFVVYIEGGIHGREWMSPATVTYVINQLLTSEDFNITALRDSFDWHIFPVVNPDGYHYSFNYDRMWRKSRSVTPMSGCHGVDLNRNWDHNFGNFRSSKDPCDYEQYAGPQPFSEVETRSMAQYILKLNKMIAYFSFHSPARCILIPYGDQDLFGPNHYVMTKIAESALAKINTHYDISNVNKVFGRTSGNALDWVFKLKKPPIAFTIELKGNKFIAPSYEIPNVGEEVMKMLSGAFEGANKLYLYKPVPIPHY